MRVGIDLDATITDVPQFFALLSGALVDAGHEVHVITYRSPDMFPREETLHDLDALGIRYTRLHLPAGSLDAPEWKARVAAELGLDIMIEDSPEVLAAMPEGVKRMWLCDPDFYDLPTCIEAMRERLR